MSTSEYREPTNDELWPQAPNLPPASGAAVPGQAMVPHQAAPVPAPVPANPTTDRTSFVLALVSLVDDREQFFAGASGLPDELLACRSTPLSHSFCKHVVATKSVLRIPDTRRHAVVHDNPAVEEFGIIAYLGVPVTTSEGHTLGSLAAIRVKSRKRSLTL